jgi:rubrerythrin
MSKVPVNEFYIRPEATPPGPEITEVERLLNEFESHETQEKDFLRQYKEVAADVRQPLIKFLLQLIISDEEKHHAVTHAMVATLKGDLNWTKPEDAIRGLYDMGEKKQELLAVTEEFIRTEKEGIRECKTLTKVSRRYYKGLFALLMGCMIHDSQKHVMILEFLRDKLKEA